MSCRVLSIDPGRAKCGIAMVVRGEGVIARAVVAVSDLPDTVRLLAARFEPDVFIIGGATGAEEARAAMGSISVPLYVVDEKFSTQRARLRYFQDHPPRGWRRLVPRGMLTPRESYDDYAAILLAEQFLETERLTKSAGNL